MDLVAITADWAVSNGYLSEQTATTIAYYFYAAAHFFTEVLTNLINQIISAVKGFH